MEVIELQDRHVGPCVGCYLCDFNGDGIWLRNRHWRRAAFVRRTVEDLDRALDERWQIADRFGTRGPAWTFRDLVATSGASLRADCRFHKEHRMFDAPSPGGLNALSRLLFKSKKLEKRLIEIKQAQIAKAREERLNAYLRHGRLGEGKKFTS